MRANVHNKSNVACKIVNEQKYNRHDPEMVAFSFAALTLRYTLYACSDGIQIR